MNRMIKKGVFVLCSVFVTHSQMYICFVIVSISDVCLLNINIMFMYFYNVDVVCMSMRALMGKGQIMCLLY